MSNIKVPDHVGNNSIANEIKQETITLTVSIGLAFLDQTFEQDFSNADPRNVIFARSYPTILEMIPQPNIFDGKNHLCCMLLHTTFLGL